MTIDQLREVHLARPFQPYRLQLADGTRVDVTHPECLAYHPKHPRTVVIAKSTGGVKIVDLLLVAAIDVRNGRADRSGRKR